MTRKIALIGSLLRIFDGMHTFLYIIVQQAILNLIPICTTRVIVGSYNVMNTIEHRQTPPAARHALK